MEKTPLLAILFISWYIFWFVYNYVLVTKDDQRKHHPVSIFFAFYIFSTFTILISGSQELFIFSYYIGIFTLLLILTIVIRNRYLVICMNSIAQMTWLYVVFTTLNNNVLSTGIVFALGHILVIFLKHVNISGKIILVTASLIGGLALAIVLREFSYPLNFILSILIHAGFYQILRPIDRKYRFNIVTD